jgi:hypothetical protein
MLNIYQQQQFVMLWTTEVKGLEIETSAINWAQLSRLLPEDGDRIHSPKRHVLNNNRKMDNVQKHNNCINSCALNVLHSQSSAGIQTM